MRRRQRAQAAVLAPLELREPHLADWRRPGDEAGVSDRAWEDSGAQAANIRRPADPIHAAATLRWWTARRAFLAEHPGAQLSGRHAYVKAYLEGGHRVHLEPLPPEKRYRNAPPGTPAVIRDYFEMVALRDSLLIEE